MNSMTISVLQYPAGHSTGIVNSVLYPCGVWGIVKADGTFEFSRS